MHQCVHCNKLYTDGSNELLKGCVNCGGRFFFYIKEGDVERGKKIINSLTPKEKDQIEKDVLDIVGEVDDDQPVFLDFESIRVMKPGKYEVDLVNLFKGKPLIYKLEDGKYVIDLIATFQAKEKNLN